MNTTSTAAEFERRGYTVLREVVHGSALQVLLGYTLAFAKNKDAPGDNLVPGTPAGYGQPLMEILLQQVLPKVESATGRALFPTYSYFRVYKHGDVLKPHKDRAACEISLSLCLGSNDGVEWPLQVRGPEGVAAPPLRPGDGVIYKGTEIEHWREAFTGEWASQVFLHYVDRSGPHAEWRYDKRPSLGAAPSGARPI